MIRKRRKRNVSFTRDEGVDEAEKTLGCVTWDAAWCSSDMVGIEWLKTTLVAREWSMCILLLYKVPMTRYLSSGGHLRVQVLKSQT